MPVHFPKESRIRNRSVYYWVQAGFWVLAVLWLGAWYWMYEVLDAAWYYKVLIGFILVLLTPDIGDLTRSYSRYNKEDFGVTIENGENKIDSD
jgi:hypothetical protein